MPDEDHLQERRGADLTTKMQVHFSPRGAPPALAHSLLRPGHCAQAGA